MGNNIDNQDYRNILNQYVLISKCNNKLFGNINLYKNKNNNNIILNKKYIFMNNSDYLDYKYIIDKYRNISDNNILKILYINKKIINNYCNNVIELELNIEYYEHNLYKEILKRRDNLDNSNINDIVI